MVISSRDYKVCKYIYQPIIYNIQRIGREVETNFMFTFGMTDIHILHDRSSASIKLMTDVRIVNYQSYSVCFLNGRCLQIKDRCIAMFTYLMTDIYSSMTDVYN